MCRRYLSSKCYGNIPNLNEIGEASRILLKEKRVLIFEDPYLGDKIKKFYTIKFMMSMFLFFQLCRFKIYLKLLDLN